MRIFIWCDEEKIKILKEKGLEGLSKEVLAGMRRIEVMLNENQLERILKLFPSAKYDKSTTNSIELLPKWFKDMLFNEIVAQGKVDSDIVERVIRKLEDIKQS
ncbi:MAG: hypothetical protein QXV69_06470 [Sulfolobaceae archaeon]